MTTTLLNNKPKKTMKMDSLRILLERARCRQSFNYFMTNYVWIMDRSDPPKIIRWKPWDYLISLNNKFGEYDDIVIGKARQLGITWDVCGYADWKTLFSEGAKVLLFSQGETEAWDLIAKCRFVWSRLPYWMRLDLSKDRLGWLQFKVSGSEMVAYPSTTKAGRSTDATLVIRDELEKHDNAADHYASVKPTVDGGGQMIDLSTIDKQVADSHFQDRINRIKSGGSKAHFIFVGWKERPERITGMGLDEWFDLKVRGEYPEWQIENEYPETEEDFFAESKTKSFFDLKGLSRLGKNLFEPLEDITEINTHNGMVKIYELPVAGNKYCIFTDPSNGIEDPHHTVVINSVTGKEVAESHGKVTADVCAMIHDSLVRLYFNAFNSYERNAYAGGMFDTILTNMSTPNRCPFISPDGELKYDKDGNAIKFGWWTSEALKRSRILPGLEQAIRLNLINPASKDTIEEFRNFIWVDGKGQAKRGWHDDRVMGWAGVWELTKHIPSVGRVETVRPVSFSQSQDVRFFSSGGGAQTVRPRSR